MKNWEIEYGGLIYFDLECANGTLECEIDSDGDFTCDGLWTYIPIEELIEMVEKYKGETK